MNTIGWLAGGGTAPLVIGLIAGKRGLGTAIALASLVYVAAGLLLLPGILFFVTRDSERMQTDLGKGGDAAMNARSDSSEVTV